MGLYRNGGSGSGDGPSLGGVEVLELGVGILSGVGVREVEKVSKGGAFGAGEITGDGLYR